jgi:hypothetical protein
LNITEDLDITEDLNITEVSDIAEDSNYDFNKFKVFCSDKDELTVHVTIKNNPFSKKLTEEEAKKYLSIVPTIFRIDSKVALPESIPIQKIIDKNNSLNKIESLERTIRGGLLNSLFGKIIDLKKHNSSGELEAEISSFISDSASQESREVSLIKSLILDVANIDRKALIELNNALRSGNQEGVVNGITQTITDNLRKSLNFPRWWEQDRDFYLKVDARDYDLVFTIVDRTGMHYSFDERSSGLKYFLSYYIQYRAYKPKNKNKSTEILLMDEPDAYLSSQAQQDLLKIFEAFSSPEEDINPVQVIYVTHSPFLINKNYAERIRVLDKGTGDEGTRVVKDASKNHYEPLRSAFGAFVGETTFIGNCNLFVEGIADQILIAGASNFIRKLDNISTLEILDLNHVTIVPAGSASHIPYLVYLARGRDIEQPAVMVLLDSDDAGKDAITKLTRGGDNGNNKPLNKELILQIGDLSGENDISFETSKLVEIEDLIPISIYKEAIKLYLKDFCEISDINLKPIVSSDFKELFKPEKGTFDNLNEIVKSKSKNKYHLEKLGLARSVVTIVNLTYNKFKLSKDDAYPSDLKAFEVNFKILLGKLCNMQRKAERDFKREKVFHRINRAKNRFLQDKSEDVLFKREDAVKLLDEIEACLDESFESTHISIEIHKLRKKYDLSMDLYKEVNNSSDFRKDIEALMYSGRRATQEVELEDLNGE